MQHRNFPTIQAGRRHARSGFTLVELLVVISMTSAVAVVGSTTVFFLMRAESNSAQSFLEDTTMSRLAARFRRDTHAAIAVEIVRDPAGDPAELRLQQPGGQVVFRALAGEVLRLETTGDQTLNREPYRLPSATAEFDLIEGGLLAVLVVQMKTSPGGSSTARPGHVQGIRIEAAVGRDHRFESLAAGRQRR